MLGKKVIVNTLVAPLFQYVIQTTDAIKQKDIVKFNGLVKQFMWGKKAKIPLCTLMLPKEKGGIGLYNIQLRDMASKAAMMARVKNNKSLSNYLYQLTPKIKCIEHHLWEMNLAEKHIKELDVRDTYWANALRSWAKFNYQEQQSVVHIKEQYLWFNSTICIGEKTILNINWWKKGLQKIEQLFNEENNIKTMQALQEEFGIVMPITWYMAVREIIKDLMKKARDVDYISTTNIKIGNIRNPMRIIAQDMVKRTANIRHENMVKKWNTRLELTLEQKDYLELFMYYTDVTTDKKILSFLIKLYYDVIFLNPMLYRWKLAEFPTCSHCQFQKQTYLHFFIECSEAKKLWGQIQGWFEGNTGENVDVTIPRIMLNLDLQQMKNKIRDLVIMITKQYMFAQFCLNEDLSFYQLQKRIKTRYQVLL